MSTRLINEPSDGVFHQWLSTLETLINPERLKEFNATYNKVTSTWNGEERGQELYVVWEIAKDRAVTLSRADPLDNPTEEQIEANKDVQNQMATPIGQNLRPHQQVRLQTTKCKQQKILRQDRKN